MADLQIVLVAHGLLEWGRGRQVGPKGEGRSRLQQLLLSLVGEFVLFPGTALRKSNEIGSERKWGGRHSEARL